jgi:invasion protein IalB
MALSNRVLAQLLMAASLAWATDGFAQSPDRSTFVYQDWVLNCDKAAAENPVDSKKSPAIPKDKTTAVDPKKNGAKSNPRCEITQTFKNNTNGQIVAIVALGKPDPEADWKFVIQLPIGIWLPSGVQISAEGKPEITGQYLRCSPTYCLAQIDAKKEIIDALKAGTSTEFQFSTAAANKVKLKLNEKGFSDAYSALEKQGQ